MYIHTHVVQSFYKATFAVITTIPLGITYGEQITYLTVNLDITFIII